VFILPQDPRITRDFNGQVPTPIRIVSSLLFAPAAVTYGAPLPLAPVQVVSRQIVHEPLVPSPQDKV
jgi:hypothetical protein